MTTFADLINSETPVLVDFYADWCGPCKMMAPELEKFAETMKGKVKVIKVDVDKNQSAAMQYRIQGIPTLVLFKKGEIKWRQSGATSAVQLLQTLTPLL